VRYAPSSSEEQLEMLRSIGTGQFEDLLEPVPEHLRMKQPLPIPGGISEMEVQARVEKLATRNLGASHLVCFTGGGAYDHFIPAAIDVVVSRSEFTTAYTPYQSEVSQGTLQVIYEFQSLVAELMGMEVANASLYDGAHSLAEAMLLACSARPVGRVLVSMGVNPHCRRMLETYAGGLKIDLVPIPVGADGRTDPGVLERELSEPASALIFSQPNFFGCLENAGELAEAVRAVGEKEPPLVVVAVYPTSLGLLAPPGEWGADVATAEGQCLGLPLSMGGPYLGLFACRSDYIRRMPGRLIGRTLDRDGRQSYVMTLQTREQHIRRAKATSNICTNQGLCATWATVYMTLLGPAGLREVAERCASKARYLADGLTSLPGVELAFPEVGFFNEFTLNLPCGPGPLLADLAEAGYMGGVDLTRFGEELPGDLLVAVTERRTRAEIDGFIQAFADALV
jgi:glycine dehydrogenase subunit 1